MTEYRVLIRYIESEAAQGAEQIIWRDTGKTIKAATSKAAVAAFVKEQKLDKGIFVAVPARSWTPVRVQAEQKVRLKFS